MLCPFCADDETRVTDSRPRGDGSVRRRRVCPGCQEVFKTDERLTTETFRVKKQDGVFQDFDRSKIVKGIEKAAWTYNKQPGRGRLAPSDINAIVNRVENELRKSGARVVPSVEIGRLVLQQLTDGTPGADVVRARFAIVFQGRTTRVGGFRGLRGLMDWLRDVYGEPTVERVDDTPSKVRKRDGTTDTFNIRSLESSIGIVAKGNGTDREVYNYAERLAAEARLNLKGQGLVTSQQIAAEVLKLFLREGDALSYMRYASAVKRYESIEDFWLEAYGFGKELGIGDKEAELPNG